eukprot:8312012-Ditylum_brightwellii.AAC.1
MPTQHWLKNKEQKSLDLNVMHSAYYDTLHENEYVQQDEMQQPLALLSQSDPNTMQYHQAMKQPDLAQFIKANVREVNTHTKKRH